MKIGKIVIVINGKGGVGKDTLIDGLASNDTFRVMNVSSITPIKKIATDIGWDGSKDERSRRFLSKMKDALTEFCDLPNRYLMDKYIEFMGSDEYNILFVHIRESVEIEKFIKLIPTGCITLQIHRAEIDSTDFNNPSDDSVNDYIYTHHFYNDDPLDISKEKFIKFIEDIMNSDVNPKFTVNQMDEIREGLENGLDVSSYAKPEFFWRQMQQIRLGLEKGLDVSSYAKPEFAWRQMREILFGLERGLDVSVYADPELSWEQMHDIWITLEK